MRLVTYTTGDGEEVTVQVTDDDAMPGGMVTRGLPSHDVVTRAEQGLDEALSRVQPAVRSMVRQLRSYADGPDEFQVEFGIQLSTGVGAFISASTTANFRVVMVWRKQE